MHTQGIHGRRVELEVAHQFYDGAFFFRQVRVPRRKERMKNGE